MSNMIHTPPSPSTTRVHMQDCSYWLMLRITAYLTWTYLRRAIGSFKVLTLWIMMSKTVPVQQHKLYGLLKEADLSEATVTEQGQFMLTRKI
jgi:hypothetical protein